MVSLYRVHIVVHAIKLFDDHFCDVFSCIDNVLSRALPGVMCCVVSSPEEKARLEVGFDVLKHVSDRYLRHVAPVSTPFASLHPWLSREPIHCSAAHAQIAKNRGANLVLRVKMRVSEMDGGDRRSVAVASNRVIKIVKITIRLQSDRLLAQQF
jgi:hypothetical protein